jgi:SseB protein N-terminal domain
MSEAPTLAELIFMDFVVPIRSSRGAAPIPGTLEPDQLRHGMDEGGGFVAAFTSAEAFDSLGPPGSDRVVMPARDLFDRAARAGDRVIVDPGSPEQVEIASGVLPFLAAGIDPATSGALRARRPLGALPALEAPAAIPEPFGRELRVALEELPEVNRAWLLRTGTAWTVGLELNETATLAEFDAARNRLHALATEHLGSRRALVVTDLRAPALRERYAAVSPPFFQPATSRGMLDRLLGR